MPSRKDRDSSKPPRPGPDEPRFDDFDVMGGDPQQPSPESQEFEDFDVTREGPGAESESVLDSLSAFTEGGTDVNAVLQAKDELERRLLVDTSERAFAAAADGPSGFDNIVGLGVGEKMVDGIPTGELAVKVFVKEKLSAGDISEAAMVPESVGGVTTDVDTTGEINAHSYTARRRPAPCGVSIGNCNAIMAGTFGCLVYRSSQLFILSNNHVIALVNRGPVGVGIPQPGRLDGGVCPNDVIARLTQWVPIAFGGALNFVDAAIAQTNAALVDPRVIRPTGLQRFASTNAVPVLNMQVQKSGRTTQYRRGLIDAVNVTIDVSYAPLGGVARFARQFRVRGLFGAIFSDRGDSGSLVSTYPGNNPVGLLFAGNAANNMTFCNPISAVLSAFGVAIRY